MARSQKPALRWLAKAYEDLDLAERAMASPARPSPGCFHAQQAVEKALKGVAIHLGAKDIPRTHSLLEIVDLIRSLGGDVPFAAPMLAQFDAYAVDVRYPEAPDPSTNTATRLIQVATDVYHWAEALVD